ncbi:MAG: DUF1641 domain-containing protein [Desulfocapsaceae bacterium]|nr:DUF1641 domain-containing protein [Desulfocapsaceae bacterium]
MDEALILEKLDNLSNEIQSLKAGVLAELKQEMMPIVHQTGPLVSDCLSELDQEQRRDDLVHFMRSLVLNVETLNSLLTTAKGAMELKNEIEPIAKLVVPGALELFSSLEGQFNADDVVALIRNSIGNIQHFNTAITMLKAGMELKDEIEPIAKLVVPRLLETFTELEGLYDGDEITALLRNTLSNVHNFNTALTMLKAGMELKDEIEPLAKLTLPGIIEFFNEMSGMLKVAGAAAEAVKNLKCSDAQAEAMSAVIRGIDLSKSNRIGPVGAVKKLYDPKVQEALGIIFTMLEAVGAISQAHRDNQ